MQAEIDAFHKSICARALLIAIEWAGSGAALSRAAGLGRYACNTWTHRGGIPPIAALILEHVEGFPLTAKEMRPDVDWSRYKPIRCNGCGKHIHPNGYRSGCRPVLRAHVNGRAPKAPKQPKRSPARTKPKASSAAHLASSAA